MVFPDPAARHLHPVPGTPPADGVADRARVEVARARAALPALDPVVFDCHLGQLARALEPTTEADPIAVLASLVCAAGVHLGPAPFVRAGDDRHPLLVWPLLIGRTGNGKKGASWGTTRRLLSAADGAFVTHNIRSGLTSGEGLAAMFTDTEPSTADSGQSGAAPAAGGGRLPGGKVLVFEPEWAGVMARMRREGNALSATLRAAWEGGDLSTLNVKARLARTSHVGLLAHITPGEFQAKVSSADLAGGTYNRFLPIAVARTKFLPGGTGADPDLIQGLGAKLIARLDRAAGLDELRLTAAAIEAWGGLYVEFSTDPDHETPVEQFLSRSAPYCLRIAAIHAALDHGGPSIGPEHLTPAAALVRYSRATAAAVLSHNPAEAAVAAWIAQAGPEGCTRTEITKRFFSNAHRTGIDPQAVLDRLIAAGQITRTMRPPAGGRGRPTEVYTAPPQPP